MAANLKPTAVPRPSRTAHAARRALRGAADIFLVAVALAALFSYYRTLGHFAAGGTHPQSAGSFAPGQGMVADAFTPAMAAGAITVAAVGDGAGSNSNDTKVADLIARAGPDLFLYLGDVYEKGTAQEFTDYYQPTYGRLRSITNPVVGNHEYGTANAAGYFGYWDNVPSYYSYDSGGWHFVALNSARSSSDLAAGSAQYEWLKRDLDANHLPCTLVYYHHPRYSIGVHGDSTKMADVWPLLAQKGVDVVLAAHDHDYQRWKPLDGGGKQAAGGVTAFVVGTGGHGIREIPGSDARVAAQHESYGALFLDLAADRAGFRFVNLAGQALDSGTVTCSGAAAPAPTPSPTRSPTPGPTPTRAPTPGAPQARTFTPAADAYVAESSPTTNYGAASAVRVDGSPVLRTYLRFDVQGLAAPVSKATLRVYATSGSSVGWRAHGTAGGWNEAAITFGSAPAPASAAGASGSFAAGNWTQADVTALVAGNGALSLALTGSGSTAIAFSSREGANPPQLVVETGGTLSQPGAATTLPAAAPAMPGPDADGDGLPDADEALNFTDPAAPDTDGDGLGDLWEVENGTNPAAPGDVVWLPWVGH